MSELLYFEDISLGQSWVSPARTVTEADVVNFACFSGDFNPLHVDHEFAKGTPFGQPIAHGLLGLSWVAGLGSRDPCPLTTAFVGIREWRFLKPIRITDTLHVRTEVAEAASSGRRHGRVVWKRQLVNQLGDVVQEGLFESLVARRTPERKLRVDASPGENSDVPSPLMAAGGIGTAEVATASSFAM